MINSFFFVFLIFFSYYVNIALDDVDIAVHRPFVRPEPVKIPVYREEVTTLKLLNLMLMLHYV